MKILGFDLGDGESSIALFSAESAVEPQVVQLLGRTSILSAVGLKDGRIVIGEEASVLAGAQDVKVRFKSRYLKEASAADDVRMFAQGVMAQLLSREPGLMAQVSRTVVGCPAGWGEGRRGQYAALMESAGFPNVQVVPEPRAAFLYARHARGLRVDPALMRESALVVDIGSSTTDFAYIVDGRQQSLHAFGDNNLGGGVLDELILRRSIAASPDAKELERVMRESPQWRSYCELEARRLKERYFLGEETWREHPLTQQLVVCYDKTLTLTLSLDAKTVGELVNEPSGALGSASFVGALEAALEAAQLASRERPPKVVILTGGASRMAFFREACRAAFPGSAMVLCPEPECSIARGLAYAGRVDERLKIFRGEMQSLISRDRLSALIGQTVHELYAPAAQIIYQTAQTCTMQSVALWRRGGLKTIDQIDASLETSLKEALAGGDVRAAMTQEIGVWAQALLDRIEGELTALCVRCGVPPEQMSLQGANVDAGFCRVKLPLMNVMGMDVLSGILGAVLAAVGAAVCGGSGMALVSSGPAGWAAGAAAGALVALIGHQGLEQALRTAELPLIMRQMVTDSAVRHGMDRQREKIESAIISALADPRSGFAGQLTASVYEILAAQLEGMARGAEMSICA